MEENRMILNISTVESEKAKNDKFASDNGITQEEMDEVYQEIFENLPDNVTGDKPWNDKIFFSVIALKYLRSSSFSNHEGNETQ